MEITGKIIQILPVETGEGRNGTWKKQKFIIETQDQYPKKVCIMVWGDKIDLSAYQINETVTASINIESHEFNSRWYTDIKAWRLEKDQAQNSTTAPQMQSNIPPDAELPPEAGESFNDLPF